MYASQSFEYETDDMRMDVTPIVNKWLDETYPNEGFIIKRSGSIGNTDENTDEGSQDRLGDFKFFSRQRILNPIRDDGPEDHIIKKIGTPTMGGFIILFGLLASVIFCISFDLIRLI